MRWMRWCWLQYIWWWVPRCLGAMGVVSAMEVLDESAIQCVPLDECVHPHL